MVNQGTIVRVCDWLLSDPFGAHLRKDIEAFGTVNGYTLIL